MNTDEAGRSAHVLGELVGLSLRSVSDCPMEFNLQPESVIRAHALSKRRPYIIMAGVCALLMLAGFWFYYWRAANVETEVSKTVDSRIAVLQPIANHYEKVKTELKKQVADAAPFQAAVADRDYWNKVLTDLNSRLPQKLIWITSFQPGYFTGAYPAVKFTPAEPGVAPTAKERLGVAVQGLYLVLDARGSQVVTDFVNNLKGSPYVDPEVQSTTQPGGNSWDYGFELNLYLKAPFKLQ